MTFVLLRKMSYSFFIAQCIIEAGLQWQNLTAKIKYGEMDYQQQFTQQAVAKQHMYDIEEREQKAKKLLAVLQDHFGDQRALRLLDMSCSTGVMASVFGCHFDHVVGIDIDAEAVGHATTCYGSDSLQFQVMDALHTSFDDSCFDIIICNQMYEHVPDADQLMREIFRILAPNGVCLFGATNRLKIIETHYGRIPFLAYLPKPAAHLYLRLLGRGDYYYETLRTYRGLNKLTAAFERLDYTPRIVREPERFYATDMVRDQSSGQRLALFVLDYAYWFFPGYIWLLRKPALRDTE